MVTVLQGLKIAILIAHGFEQVEMTKPRKALENAGATVHIVSPEQGKVKGWHWEVPKPGSAFNVDVPLDKANPKDYDALVLPGGLMSPDDLRLNAKAISFIKGFSDKPIAAICHGPSLLIDANLISSKKVTSWPSIKHDLINAGATWIDREVVKDGNLITSRMPQDIAAFNKAMIETFAQIKTKKAHESAQTGYTVVAMLEAKPKKESVLKEELKKVAAFSRAEATCIEYHLHQDRSNKASFILYEKWKDKEAHQRQFQKPYIIELVKKLDDLLAKPYFVVFAEEIY
jgi:protease I